MSTDHFNETVTWRSLTVVPCTSSGRYDRPSPTTVILRAGEAGLPRDCAALAHQITTIDKAKMMGPILGQLSPVKLRELNRALINYLQLF